MKRAGLLIAFVAVLALVACARDDIGTIEQAVEAREACRDAGGVFASSKNDFGDYVWECDLSDRRSQD